ncbi:hypothetical protein LSH36_772g00010 [Paralvinella palmiformis]|uniref:BPTI/Kunitz inhibitor domain-containing protein n=1 Tax=Paralvinella palmiformis TaxID=53620 RepID=A0AAD9MSX9_9ANNE|nr:hypothetical protein LSH36_772g00010 [Paralvinella palmiformis]
MMLLVFFSPKKNMKCKEGQVCELRTMPCLMPPCPRQAVCVDDRRCPLIRCTPGCPPMKDPDGCDFCDCSDPCQRCNPDQTCEVYHVPCIRPPCPSPFKVCKDKPRCPSVLCTPECPPNKGPDGCDFCDCGDPCQECRPDQSCELLYPPCFGGDCRPPMGICKDLPKPPTDRRCAAKPRLTSCSYRFRFRYIYDVDYGTCRRLRRRTCSSSLNKFRTMRACLQACEAPPPPPPLINGRPGDNVQVGGWPSMLDHFGRRT